MNVKRPIIDDEKVARKLRESLNPASRRSAKRARIKSKRLARKNKRDAINGKIIRAQKKTISRQHKYLRQLMDCTCEKELFALQRLIDADSDIDID